MSRSFVALILFSAITSAVMSAIVCGVMTYKMAGLSAAFMHTWAGGWMTAWPVAFTVILIAGPFIRKTVYNACKCPQVTLEQSVPGVEKA
jgi:integral membrane sensor domain MASE1